MPRPDLWLGSIRARTELFDEIRGILQGRENQKTCPLGSFTTYHEQSSTCSFTSKSASPLRVPVHIHITRSSEEGAREHHCVRQLIAHAASLHRRGERERRRRRRHLPASAAAVARATWAPPGSQRRRAGLLEAAAARLGRRLPAAREPLPPRPGRRLPAAPCECECECTAREPLLPRPMALPARGVQHDPMEPPRARTARLGAYPRRPRCTGRGRLTPSTAPLLHPPPRPRVHAVAERERPCECERRLQHTATNGSVNVKNVNAHESGRARTSEAATV